MESNLNDTTTVIMKGRQTIHEQLIDWSNNYWQAVGAKCILIDGDKGEMDLKENPNISLNINGSKVQNDNTILEMHKK